MQAQTQQRQQQENKEILRNIMSKSAEKAVKKRMDAYAEETPTDKLLPHTDTANKMKEEKTEANKPIEPTSKEVPPTGPLAMGGAEMNDSGLTIHKPSALMGFLFGNMSVNRDLQRIGSRQKLTGVTDPLETQKKQLENLLLQQKATGTEPIQAGEKEKLDLQQKAEQYKQDRLDEREKLKATLKDSGVDDKQANAQLFQDDINNLMTSFINVPIKGRGQGGLSALGGFIGFGREERARFQAAVEVFPFRAAEFIAQQTARALSDKDFERIKVLSQFKLGAGEQKTTGQLQALLDFTNSRLKAAGVAPLPNAKEFLKQARNQTLPGVQGVTKSGNKFRRK